VSLCKTYMDEYGGYHAHISPKLREARELARYVVSGIRSSSGVKVVEVDGQYRAIDWGNDSTGESWCKEVSVNEAIRIIYSVAKWCLREGTLLSPHLPLHKQTIETVREAGADFRCWRRVKEKSIEVFVSKELIPEVFKD
jgi:hypothetical protein